MAGTTNQIAYACRSDIGRVRANNEDAFGAFPEAGVWCVADGMGGGDDGEVASTETVGAVAAFAGRADARNADTPAVVSGVRAAVSAASGRIFDRAREKGLSGCGSTFVGLVLGREPGCPAHALHAGDSRLYRVRGGAVRRITRDHSVAEAAGVRSEAELNPQFRSMILRAVGVERGVELDDTPFDLRPGDRVILCSDGLSRKVPDAALATLTAARSADEAARALVDAANAAGGEDNVTVVVVDCNGTGRGERRTGARLVALAVAVAVVALVAFLTFRALRGTGSEGCADDRAAADSSTRRLLDEAARMEREAQARLESTKGTTEN